MIHYNVWFSIKKDADITTQLQRCENFLADAKSRSVIHGYCLLKNRGKAGETKLPTFQAIIQFLDDDQFALPFNDVRRIGIHAGEHGLMIEDVDDFTIEVFEEI